MHAVRLTFALVGFGCLLWPTLGQEPPASLKPFQGRWQAIAVESDGMRDGAKAAKSVRASVNGDQLSLRFTGTVTRRARMRLDPSKSPKTIELTLLEGEETGATVRGIYAFEKGEWKICVPNFDAAGKPSPREFATRPGDGLVLLILQRLGDAK